MNREGAQRLKLLRAELAKLSWEAAVLAHPSEPDAAEVTVSRRPMWDEVTEPTYRWTARVTVSSEHSTSKIGLDLSGFGRSQRGALRHLCKELRTARELMR